MIKVYFIFLFISFFTLSCVQKKTIEIITRDKNNNFNEVITKHYWEPESTALVVFDMCNKRHCKPAEKRVQTLSVKFNVFINKLRKKGLSIIIAPSAAIKPYSHLPSRKNIIRISKLVGKNYSLDWLRQFPGESIYPVPYGCIDETQNSKTMPWTRQIKTIEITPNDVVSDREDEIINYLHYKKNKTILFKGVHSNVCVVGRTYGIRNLKQFGLKTILIEDLTDSYTKNAKHQKYTQDQRNEIIIKHIGFYVSPTTLSSSLIKVID